LINDDEPVAAEPVAASYAVAVADANDGWTPAPNITDRYHDIKGNYLYDTDVSTINRDKSIKLGPN
jgi:hypothetical protein